MRFEILIPSCKKYEDVKAQIDEIDRNTPEQHRIIATCQELSAAQNRNIAHKLAESEICVSMDDDITGFYPGWLSDLVRPLLEDTTLCKSEEVMLVTARYLRPDRTLAHQMHCSNKTADQPYLEITRLPTACFAYRKSQVDGIIKGVNKPFDENFLGSGFEDDSFCIEMQKKYPDLKFVLNNTCKLIHINEMKNQKGANWESNKKYIISKYPKHPVVWH